jgi:hypothetical protein
MQLIVEKYYGKENPYKKVKEENLRKAEKYNMFLKMMIEGSCDKLDTAMRAAIIGNVLILQPTRILISNMKSTGLLLIILIYHLFQNSKMICGKLKQFFT